MRTKIYYLLSPTKQEDYQSFLDLLSNKNFRLEKFEPKNFTADATAILMVIGGDGSLHHAVNLLMPMEKSKRPPILYIPGGTANDFFKSLTELDPSLPPEVIFERSLSGKLASLPVLQCNDRYFINVASGLNFAEVTEAEPGPIKNLLGRWLYYLSGLKKTIERPEFQMEIVENEQRFLMRSIGFCITNGAYAGGGIRVGDENLLREESFGVLLVPPLSNLELAQLALNLQEKYPHPEEFGAISRQTPELLLRFSEEVLVKLDGESYRSHEMKFKTLKDAISIYFPS